VFYCLLETTVFPAEKYRMVHQRLLDTNVATPDDFVTPQPASDDDVLLVHTREYVQKLKNGTLTAQEEMQMEVPYSPELVKAFWLSAGGSVLAADLALRDGVAVNIGGSFHHAFPDHGEGFCVIHDVAVPIKRMHREGKIPGGRTLDLDAHNGKGTAAIFPPQQRAGHPLPSASASRMDIHLAPLEEHHHAAGQLEVFTI